LPSFNLEIGEKEGDIQQSFEGERNKDEMLAIQLQHEIIEDEGEEGYEEDGVSQTSSCMTYFVINSITLMFLIFVFVFLFFILRRKERKDTQTLN